MVLLPLPFIRSIGIGGMLIPAVSVIVSITLLPALLSVLGPRINSAARHAEALRGGEPIPSSGWWGRWADSSCAGRWPVAAVGLAIVGVLVALRSPAQSERGAGQGLSRQGRCDRRARRAHERRHLARGDQAVRRPDTCRASGEVVSARGDGVRVSQARLRRRLAEGRPRARRSDSVARRVEQGDPRDDHAGQGRLPAGATLGGVAPEDRDFVHAVYGNFAYVLLFVILLTYVLLARAFRSLLLPLKAVILNLVSLGAAFGIIVFIFQQGHGSDAIWGVPATQSIIPWIPLMIFAFLFGLSMDYEVFMLTRMREAYDETGNTSEAIAWVSRAPGKLVTSAALVLMFAFFVLSTSPGTDIKQFGIGLAAGIIFDATVIRALLVPALMLLMGRWNWWLPAWAARPLRTQPSEPVVEARPATEPA